MDSRGHLRMKSLWLPLWPHLECNPASGGGNRSQFSAHRCHDPSLGYNKSPSLDSKVGMAKRSMNRGQSLSRWWRWLTGFKYWGLSVILLLVIQTAVPALESDPSTLLTQESTQTTPIQTFKRPTLQVGSQGTEVSELQATLKLLGYYDGSVDGVYSQQTAEAVSAFQKAAGLSGNGIVDQQTWNRLFPPTPGSESRATTCVCPQSASATPTPSNATDTNSRTRSVSFPILQLGMRGDAVSGLQERLRAKGFLQSPVDGVFGSATQAAVQAAQAEYELKSDGIVGSQTWLALLR